MENANNVLVDIQDLKVQFFLHEGTVHALEGVSFQIQQGKTLGVIGESGSGKSVTAQAIMGIIPSPPGKVVDGRVLLNLPENGASVRVVNVTELPPSGSEIRSIRGKEVSMIFQEPM
ncbi:MAG: ATP-binding cassette domain-containing protein, partial [Caldilinea sp.]|nr:ATP-binding cassette domain-containing protein [Caldilinea sp.]MCB0049580.1 ATP-binding cassette domain-containing protein [Caldilinea sp.]MCB0050312.1 ATP-binding cassette domain-containing protein [Caldilinea sp.]